MDLFVGVMSGTSMDGVDTALVDLGKDRPVLLGAHAADWPPTLRERLQTVAAGAPVDARTLAVLDAAVGRFLATAIDTLLERTRTDPARVRAIGCHGQTVAHAPDAEPPATLQLGDANIISELTGITTVNDFRRRDMAAGGQGAPLAPAFHEAVLRAGGETRVVVNLGGIANITVLPADAAKPASGFDTGPASCLMDAWTRRHTGQPYDEDGAWAAGASPDPALLSRLLADPYFAAAPPKSTGTQYFSPRWLDAHLAAAPALEPVTVQATLLALTTASIAQAILDHAPGTQRVLVCGGGVHNRILLQDLAARLALPVVSTADEGVDPDWMEAMAFAWLAQRTLAGTPGNLPAVTGAAGPRILGAIHPA